MSSRAVLFAATKQHVGKTSVSLAAVAEAQARFANPTYLKPVGQQHVPVDNSIRVDKDVLLAQRFFGLEPRWQAMSPVVFPKGYTRSYLDGEISNQGQIQAVREAFDELTTNHDYVVVEGTGHVGVGSVCELNNAQVAAALGLDIVMVCNGGIGSSFDELELNRIACKEYGVRVRGVVVNKVKIDKLDMVREYFLKALKRHNLPLLGCVPDQEFLGSSTMLDMEQLFGTELLCGHENRLQHFNTKNVKLITSGLRRFLENLENDNLGGRDDLLVTHASRNDIILGVLAHARLCQRRGEEFSRGVILTGVPPKDAPQEYILEVLRTSSVPFVYAPVHSFRATSMISNYTAKLNSEDVTRTQAAVDLYRKHIDWDRLFHA